MHRTWIITKVYETNIKIHDSDSRISEIPSVIDMIRNQLWTLWLIVIIMMLLISTRKHGGHRVTRTFCGRKLARLYDILFCHKTLVIACDEPKDYACDRDY